MHDQGIGLEGCWTEDVGLFERTVHSTHGESRIVQARVGLNREYLDTLNRETIERLTGPGSGKAHREMHRGTTAMMPLSFRNRNGGPSVIRCGVRR